MSFMSCFTFKKKKITGEILPVFQFKDYVSLTKPPNVYTLLFLTSICSSSVS